MNEWIMYFCWNGKIIVISLKELSIDYGDDDGDDTYDNGDDYKFLLSVWLVMTMYIYVILLFLHLNNFDITKNNLFNYP